MAEVTTRIIRDGDLSASEKLVYLYLAAEYRVHYRNPIDLHSYEELGAEINLGAATVRKTLKRLEEVELVKLTKEPHLKARLLHLDTGYTILRQLASAGGA